MRGLLATVLFAFGLCAANAVQAQGIHRCEGPDGVTIYTDRECRTLGAVDRKVDLEAAPRTAPPGVRGRNAPLLDIDCARTPDMLLFDLRRGAESGDANRLASVFHWAGVGSGAARHLMDRLQRLVDRPPDAIEFIYPPIAPVHEDPYAFPQGTPVEDPIGVRMLFGAFGSEPSREFRLVRHAACWWVGF